MASTAQEEMAFKREVLHSIAPRIAREETMSRHESQPKISVVGVHFDPCLSSSGSSRGEKRTDAGRHQSASLSNVPFSDGIAFKRSWFQHLPKRFALSMHWPLDKSDFNRPRSDSAKPEAGSGSLVYYRTLCDLNRTSSADWQAHFHLPDNAQPGETVMRVWCEKPCWSTSSKRYESPIRVALGVEGPVLWEAWPTTPSNNKKQDHSNFVLHCVRDGYRSRLCTEDVLGLVFSAADNCNNVFALSAKLETVITTQTRGGQPEVTYTDATVDPTVAYFDLNHVQVGDGSKAVQNASCLAFLIAFFEASQAMRNEESGGTRKGRRDEYGRLNVIPLTGLKKVWSR